MQRVAIYSRIIFNDAYKNQLKRPLFEESKKPRFQAGETISIFELSDLMGKCYPVNHVTLKLIDCLKPEKF